MSKRLITTGTTVILLGALLPVSAGERITKVAKVTATRTQIATTGFRPIREFHGNLTLVQAVEIALRQNPDILRAIQEIERTRGLIIEVRAQALPQITLTGSYSQQDRRLIEGGAQEVAEEPGTSILASLVRLIMEGVGKREEEVLGEVLIKEKVRAST